MKLKFSFIVAIGFFMSVIMSFIMSVFAPIVAGAPLDPMGLLIGTAAGTVIGTVVMSIIPVFPLATKWAVACGAKEGSLSWFLLMSVLLCTVVYAILSFCLTLINLGGFPPFFLNVWLGNAPVMWAICYICAILFEPLCMFLAGKLTHTPPPLGAPPAE